MASGGFNLDWHHAADLELARVSKNGGVYLPCIYVFIDR